MRRFTSLLLVLTMLGSMAPGLSFAATAPVAATAALAAAPTTTVASAEELSAAVASETITDITLSQNIDTTAQLTISRPVTVNGAGFTLKVTTDLGKVNGSKHAIMLQGGVAGNPIVINDLVVDSNSFAYGVSTYNAAVVELNKVTIKNSKGAGLTVNGSNVTATDFATSGNAWGAVNVDPGSGVLTPSVFMLLGNPTLGETNKIWSDRAYVTDTATVSVVAAAYKPTKVGSVDVWVLPRTVDVADTAALILAIRDLKPYDKLVLAEGTYDVKRDLGDLTFGGQTGWYLPISQPGVTITGAGYGKTTLTSSVYAANGSWASQDFVSVWANDVTIQDLTIEAKTETNKAIEVMGKNFTLKNIDVMTNPIGPDGPDTNFYNFSGSVYFNPQASVSGVAGDVGTSRVENVWIEGAWLSASTTNVTAGTISLKDLTIDWMWGGYAGLDGYGMMSTNPAVFKVESGVALLVDNTIADLNAQAISRMPAGAELTYDDGKSKWTFNGTAITDFVSPYHVNALDFGVNAYNLDFTHSGNLPATAKVAVSLGASAANKTFDSHKFVGGKLSAVVERVTADAKGVVTMSVDRGDAWFLYEYRVQTVAFNSNGGSAVADRKVVYDAYAAAPVSPTKAGYTFAGWFTNADLTHPANFASDKIIADATMYAKYAINTNLVTFKGWNGATIVTRTVNYGSAAVAPEVTAPVGYVFTGWDKALTNITAPVTTTARFTKSAIVRTSPYLSDVVAPRTMSRFRNSTITGYMKPPHTPGSRPVRIYRWKQTASGAWKSYGYVTAKATKNYSYTRYTTSIRLGYAGKWKLRSYAPADAAHTAKWSAGYDYVTVK